MANNSSFINEQNDVKHVWGSNRNFGRKMDSKIGCLGKFLDCENTGLSYIKLNAMANFRPDVPPEFLESDDEIEFEGFRDDEIDNNDLSVNEYSSESESEESAS